MDKICQKLQESYGVDTLSPTMKDHLTSCPLCQEFIARQEALQGMLASWQVPDASSDFDLNVMAPIAEHECNKTGLFYQVRNWFTSSILVPAPVGAIVIVLLCVSFFANFVQWHEPPTVEQGMNTMVSNPRNDLVSVMEPENDSLKNRVVYTPTYPQSLQDVLSISGGVGIIIVAPHIVPTTRLDVDEI
jgi:hypothetical protein